MGAKLIVNSIVEGLIILAKYYPDEDFAAEHDQIWYAPYKPEDLISEDFSKLQDLNWFENHDSWSHFF